MTHVARAACHAALALACMADAAAPAHAAEWSVAPSISWGADNDSNRYLTAEPQATQSASLFASLQLQRATETTQLSFTPDLHWQQFYPRAFGRIFERDLNGAASWTRERGSLSVTAQDADQSTLTTEPTQTGVLQTNLHRLLDQASIAATFDQSERRTLTLDLSYADVRYAGAGAAETDLLLGYRNPSVSAVERFTLSEKAVVSASVFASDLVTHLPGTDTHQAGGQLDYSRTLSERTQLDISAGAVRVHSGAAPQTSTIASVDISRTMSLGNVALAYSRSLVPYGTGSLVLRQQWTLSGTRNITEALDANASVGRVQNSQPVNEPQLGIPIPQVQTYNTAQLALHWHTAETWTLGAELGATQTRTVEADSQTVHDWRASVTVTWTPRGRVKSF